MKLLPILTSRGCQWRTSLPKSVLSAVHRVATEAMSEELTQVVSFKNVGHGRFCQLGRRFS